MRQQARRAQHRAKPDAAPLSALEAMARAHDEGRTTEAARMGEALVAHYPRSLMAHNLLGVVYIGMADWPRARAVLERAVRLDATRAGVHSNLALALLGEGRAHDAARAARAALLRDPAHGLAQNSLGNALKALGNYPGAIRAYGRALELRPDYADAANNLGVAHQMSGDADAAIAAYARAIALAPGHAAAFNNLGSMLAEGGRDAEAMDAFARALALAPGYSESWCNLGACLKRAGRLDEAMAALDRAVTLAPDNAQAHNERGNVLVIEDRFAEAAAAYQASLTLAPGQRWVSGNLLHTRAALCDWRAVDVTCPGAQDAAQPFSLLTLDDDPARQQADARSWARARFGASLPRPPLRPADGRIRVGYFSADFHDHATMHLLAGTLRCHDRSAFEISAFSYGPPREGDAMRRFARAHVDHFIDTRGMADADVAVLARERGIDIAVDLKGNTFESRTGMFARGLAPVQISWLGYPGTMGADFLDYIIADARVIPADMRRFYDEKVIWLPGSYQPNDDQRLVAAAGTRADHGLPDGAFVFACFNQNYKISPAEWDIWMRLLTRVPGAVLWLVASNPWSRANLIREAASRGVDAGRLIFAERLPQAEHLARQRHADLFLDTFHVGAHTTASDALWGGLPVLSLAGRAFAARVGVSLLHAAGLSDMVVGSPAEYEARALELALDPAALAEIRARLSANPAALPLFDTTAHTAALEAAYCAALEHARTGLPPKHLEIT